MTLTDTHKELEKYASKNDYIPLDIVESYRQRLEYERNREALETVLEDFVNYRCPNCGAVGLFKVHLGGKLIHPSCSWFWYVSYWVYLKSCMKMVFKEGKDEIVNDTERVVRMSSSGSDVLQGCLRSIMMSFWSIVIGILLSLLLIPIRMLVIFVKGKSGKRTGEATN